MDSCAVLCPYHPVILGGAFMLFASVAAAVVMAFQGASATMSDGPADLQQIQYRAYGHPPPCGNGWDLSARDGLCYPNGYLRPRDQAARLGQYYGGGRYPVPCGNGADLDTRDGQCYPNGMVPLQFQQGLQQYYGNDDGYQPRPRRRYYYGN
jgi:hypothetical protein